MYKLVYQLVLLTQTCNILNKIQSMHTFCAKISYYDKRTRNDWHVNLEQHYLLKEFDLPDLEN